MAGTEKTKDLLTTYLRRLTNLSGNNRSLFLPRLSAAQFIDLQELSQLNKEKAFALIEALIAEKKKTICPVLDSRMEASNEASKKLKKLQRLDHFIFEESGANDLHLGWPFVRGKFSDGTLVRCPLLFFPVEIRQEQNTWVLAPRKEGEISFNKSFLLAYAFFNKVTADEALLDETFEDRDKDSTVFRTQLYQLLQKSALDINFNADNYRDELTAFIDFKRPDFEALHKNGELKLFPEAVLGIFPQAGSYLVPDYLQLIEENIFPGLDELFNGTTSEKNPAGHYVHQVREEKVYNTQPMDSWQENALKATKLGHSLVVQGPPGTGKSHLICNLICDAMATGKRVLVVCQKRAALDVVYQRMATQGLDGFLALVHDFKNDRQDIYQKAAQQIGRVDEYKAKNFTLDAILLERKFLQVGQRIDELQEELETFRTALFDRTESGTSIKELYLQSDPHQPVVGIRQEYQYFKFNGLNGFLRKLKTYCDYALVYKDPAHLWIERIPFSAFTVGDLPIIKNCLAEAKDFFESLTRDFTGQFNTMLDWEQCEELLGNGPTMAEIKKLLSAKNRYRYFQKMLTEQDDETSALWLANMARVAMDCFEGDGPETTLAASQLGPFQEALHRSMNVRKSPLGLLRWQLFSKDKFLLKRTLAANALEINKVGFEKLERKLDSRLNLEHNLSKLKSKNWLMDLPATITKKELSVWFQNSQTALKAKLLYNTIRGIKNLVNPASITEQDFAKKTDILFRLILPLHEKRERWLGYLAPSQISLITREPTVADRLAHSLFTDFDPLAAFDQLTESLAAYEKAVIDKLHEQAKGWQAEEMKKLFLNSLCLAWIDHVETKYPVLRMVSSGKLPSLEEELKEQLQEKQRISTGLLLLRARERVTDDLVFNRANNRVTYRDLLHQVTKKKKIWPVRKTVTEFDEEIFKLLPCWLASPESVSAIFPMKKLFDLVIFDEASQCFAERGIPSLYRGKLTVVAGDSKQLRPGDFYQARWQEEEEENPDTEIDSLLELASRYLPHVQLQGHYRSKSLELIDFSNRHFYEGRLQLLPDRHTFNQPTPAIEYVKTEGIWENNTNETEAVKIASLALEHVQKYPGLEIGIVTFNAPQQQRVLDTIEEKFLLAELPLPKNLFVKNIENVQGDERDLIIFSIGYAPDKKGNVSAQFGSLNTAGGENRLNVAVSRAKEKIIIVTSLWPAQLDVTETKNSGPKLLKDYLTYALNVSNGLFKPYVTPSEKNAVPAPNLKDQIKKWALEKWKGYRVEDDLLPFYDLMVSKDSEALGALLTDDEPYRQSLSAKTPHALAHQLLEEKNWPFTRVYSRNFWLDRDRFFNEVAKFITR